MSLKNKIEKVGYIVLKNVFSSDELNECKKEIMEYVRSGKGLKNAGGVSIPDFVGCDILPKTCKLKDNEKIQEALKDIFNGDNYRFCKHNDVGVNRICGWHKDKLNGDVSKYQTIDIWSTHNGEKHEIVKVLIYLQDTKTLKVVPKSHLVRKINGKEHVIVDVKVGDVVIFDQRITHRGMEKQDKNDRILVSFGFGRNNVFTDNFEKGTVIRQDEQNGKY